MSLQIKWRDGLGNQVEEVLDIDPGNASGQVEETLSSVLNKGLDRRLEFKVATPTGQQDTIVVNQEGCRQAYVTSDGQRYVTSDNQVYGVLKDPLPCDECEGGVSYIILNQNLTDPAQMISGDVNGEAIQWIRNNSHRVLAKKTGEGVVAVCRLDDSNSNYFHDGASADLTGSQGDVFMWLPKFWYHAEEIEPDIWKIGFSDHQKEGWKEWDGKDLIGVYKAYSDGTKLYSRSGVKPTGNVSHSDFKARATANGDGYSLVKFKHHSMMAFLFYAIYGNTNSQAICGKGTSYSKKVSGQTDLLGMVDTIAGGNGDSGSINFFGLENWWGDVFELVDNVSINNYNQVWTITEDDGSTRDVQAGTSKGYISKVSVGENLDMVPTDVGAINSTGFCDYYDRIYHNALVFARSCSGLDAYGGVACASANSKTSDTSYSSGSRLAFRGTINEIESSTEFMATQAVS